jgi:hypothetical protein
MLSAYRYLDFLESAIAASISALALSSSLLHAAYATAAPAAAPISVPASVLGDISILDPESIEPPEPPAMMLFCKASRTEAVDMSAGAGSGCLAAIDSVTIDLATDGALRDCLAADAAADCKLFTLTALFPAILLPATLFPARFLPSSILSTPSLHDNKRLGA